MPVAFLSQLDGYLYVTGKLEAMIPRFAPPVKKSPADAHGDAPKLPLQDPVPTSACFLWPTHVHGPNRTSAAPATFVCLRM